MQTTTKMIKTFIVSENIYNNDVIKRQLSTIASEVTYSVNNWEQIEGRYPHPDVIIMDHLSINDGRMVERIKKAKTMNPNVIAVCMISEEAAVAEWSSYYYGVLDLVEKNGEIKLGFKRYLFCIEQLPELYHEQQEKLSLQQSFSNLAINEMMVALRA